MRAEEGERERGRSKSFVPPLLEWPLERANVLQTTPTRQEGSQISGEAVFLSKGHKDAGRQTTAFKAVCGGS